MGPFPDTALRRRWYDTLAKLRNCPATLERDLLLLGLDAGELRYRAENGRALGALNRLGGPLPRRFFRTLESTPAAVRIVKMLCATCEFADRFDRSPCIRSVPGPASAKSMLGLGPL